MSHDSQLNNRYLSFSLGEEEYGIQLLSVKEVIAMPEITPIPFSPPHFKGIMNLRGQVISVLDLRQKFNIKPSAHSEVAVVICEIAPICLGVIVDAVNSVLTPLDSELSGPPDVQSANAKDYITAVYRKEKRLVLLLDIAKTLNAQDYIALSQKGTAQKPAA
jgi:purine-binding chemotaxis protein CheW